MEEQHSTTEETHFCPNCQSPLINQAGFCHKCGQKNTTSRLTVKELFSQFFDSVFNVDSKIFRTLGAVFIPRKLTNAFLNGQRQKYYHPIRLFLIALVIAIASVSFQGDLSPPGDLQKDQVDKLEERKRLMTILDESIQTIKERTVEQLDEETLDTLSKVFYRNSGKRIHSINVNDAIKITDDFDFFVAVEDIGKYSPKEIIDIYEVKGFFKRLIVQQKIKMIKEGTNFIPFVKGKATWAVFFVLLILTLIFKLLYFKSDILYLEHLIFGIHLNSFFFLVAAFLNLFSEGTIESRSHWVFMFLAIYLFIAMKRVYKQSFLITFLKFVLTVICYFFSFIFGIILIFVGSFLLF